MKLIVDVIYQVLLVANLEIDPFAISSKVEDILILSLGVLEMAGFLLADTSARLSYPFHYVKLFTLLHRPDMLRLFVCK